MRVYVVSQELDYPNSQTFEVVAAFATREQAETCCKERKKADDNMYVTYEYTELELEIGG